MGLQNLTGTVSDVLITPELLEETMAKKGKSLPVGYEKRKAYT